MEGYRDAKGGGDYCMGKVNCIILKRMHKKPAQGKIGEDMDCGRMDGCIDLTARLGYTDLHVGQIRLAVCDSAGVLTTIHARMDTDSGTSQATCGQQEHLQMATR